MSGPYYVITRASVGSPILDTVTFKTELQAIRYAQQSLRQDPTVTIDVVGVTATISADVHVKVVRR